MSAPQGLHPHLLSRLKGPVLETLEMASVELLALIVADISPVDTVLIKQADLEH